MLDINLLGTGGTIPLPERHLTALLVRCGGRSLLIDCGEGTQIAMQERGLGMKPIDMICFTHFHADHTAGLPGFLLTMGKQGRTEPVTFIGPKGLTKIVKSLCVIAPELPFPVNFTEIEGGEQTFPLGDLVITAFEADHSVQCYGYTIELPRAGKFDAAKALEFGIPKPFWGVLQRAASSGKTEGVEVDGKIFTPDMVMGAPRKGLKVTYCTDTRPTRSITEHANGSDLFICEGMYAEEDKLDKAIEKKHMLFREAAETAKTAQVSRLWLTHYSPSLGDPTEYLAQVRGIFPETETPLDGMSADLNFSD